MMEDEVVRRRGWLTRAEFLDLVGATNLIPGPNSTELAIHIGLRRGGGLGLVVAGACFILPAALMVTAIAWAYVRFGSLPPARALLRGVTPVVVAVVLQALGRFARTAFRTRTQAAVGIAALAASAVGVHELIVLGGSAALSTLAGPARRAWGRRSADAPLAAALPLLAAPAAPALAAPFGLWPLFLVFLKVGAVLFGSGYVLLAFLRADLVERLHWLTSRQLLDAVAVGQVTPGPVFTTATFVGYVLGGAPGAAIATLGIFLPAFLFVAASGPLLPRLRRSPVAGAALDGLNTGSLALMALVTWSLGRVALVDAFTIALAALTLLLMLRWRVNSAWLVLGGGLAGLVEHALRLAR
jgi:chromate transporter